MDGLEAGLGDISLKEKKPPGNHKQRQTSRKKVTPAPHPSKRRNFGAAANITFVPPLPHARPPPLQVEYKSIQNHGSSKGPPSNRSTVQSLDGLVTHVSQTLTDGNVEDLGMQAGESMVSLPLDARNIAQHQHGGVLVPYEPIKSAPRFCKVPPWRVDKSRRFSSHQALQNPRSATTVPPILGRWTGSPPPTTRHSLRTLTTDACKLPPSAEKTRNKPSSRFKPPKPLPVPTPDKAYLSLASRPANRLQYPQRLLLVLDLNGTLLYRKPGSSIYRPRPFLPQFLQYCLSNHRVLIWSSATPVNVSGICAHLFAPEQRVTLLGEWGRDTFGLNPAQYAEKTQVYKRLDRIWANETLQHTHHWSDVGGRWGQHNTLLLDDSVLKARAQPHNLVQMPEFTRSGDKKAGFDVLGLVTSYLEEARKWDNVSSFVKNTAFEVSKGWSWDWSETRSSETTSASELDQEDGGVKI